MWLNLKFFSFWLNFDEFIFSLVEQKSGSCLKTAAKTQKRLHKREGDRSFLFHLLSMNHDPNHLHFFSKVQSTKVPVLYTVGL